MATTGLMTACFICEQQNCPYLPSRASLEIGEPTNTLSHRFEFRESSQAEYEEYFHRPCQRCDHPAAREALGKPLCLRCQHLRLRHFFVCTAQDDRLRGLKLLAGTYAQIKEGRREACEFCTFAHNSVQIQRAAGIYMMNDAHDLKDHVEAHIRRQKDTKQETRKILWTPGPDFLPVSMGLVVDSSGTGARDGFRDTQKSSMVAAGSHIPWNVVKEWLFECDSHHHHHDSLEIARTTENLPHGLLVIDVETGCIVDAPQDCSYMALSYVWGDLRPGELIATAATEASLRTPGSLTKDTLPPTIWDACTACRELGFRYLWVDRLCIIQDSYLHKPEQIRAMDVIYARSSLTICAVGSPDSHTGLWGANDTPRSLKQGYARIGDVQFIQKLPDDRRWRLGHEWWKRAWTYQEYLLSRRKILTSPWQVTFECDHGSKTEGLTLLDKAKTPETALRDRNKPRLRKYEDIVEEYNDRKLSWQDDIYDAFKGVFKFMYGSVDQFVWGLPAIDFDRALLWQVESLDPWFNGSQEVSRGNPRVPKRGVHLATWSWVNRSGRTTLGINLPTVISSVARWNIWDDTKGLQPVVTDGLAWEDEEYAAIHAWAAWVAGCIETPIPRELMGSFRLLSLREKLARKWPNYQHYWRDVFAKPAPWICKSPREAAMVKERTGRILLRTALASLRFDTVKDPDRSWPSLTFPIRDHSGKIVGGLIEPTFAPTFTDYESKAWDFVALSVGPWSLGADSFERKDSSGEVHDFTPLPQHKYTRDSYTWFKKGCEISGADARRALSPDYTIHDDEGYALFPPTAVNVMMISWDGDVARREALGWVWLTKWMKAKPVFRTIVLE